MVSPIEHASEGPPLNEHGGGRAEINPASSGAGFLVDSSASPAREGGGAGQPLKPVSREELYKEIWIEPATIVADRYGVSSSFLGRVCERLKVPRPPRGYWARLRVGKAPLQPPLPEAQPGDEVEWSRDGPARRSPEAVPKAPERHIRRRAVPQPDRPDRHELLAGARDQFNRVRESDDGYLRPFKRLLVDVYVSRDTLDRTLDAANALFLALEDRGHRVEIAPHGRSFQRLDLDVRSNGGPPRFQRVWSPSRPTVVFVGTVGIALTFYELSEEVEVDYENGKYVRLPQVGASNRRRRRPLFSWMTKHHMPSGRLCLRAASPYMGASWEQKWPESAPGELINRIPRIIRVLEAEAATIAKLVEEARIRAKIEYRRWEAERQKEEEREAARRREQKFKESREELFAIIEAWGVAKRIEAFFEDATRRAEGYPENEKRVLLGRLEQARAMLGSVDALERLSSWKSPEERYPVL